MIGYSVPSKKSIEYPEKYPALKYDIISCHVPENRIYSGIFYHMIYILYKSGGSKGDHHIFRPLNRTKLIFYVYFDKLLVSLSTYLFNFGTKTRNLQNKLFFIDGAFQKNLTHNAPNGLTRTHE